MEEVCRTPVRQLLASCRALKPGWPVGVPPPPVETQAPFSGTPGARGSLTRSAQLGPHPQSPSETPPPAFLATVPAHAYLLPILQGCSLESLQPLLHKCWMFIHSWGSFDSTGWGPGPCNGLKGKGQGDVLAHAIVGSTGQVPLRSQDGSAN